VAAIAFAACVGLILPWRPALPRPLAPTLRQAQGKGERLPALVRAALLIAAALAYALVTATLRWVSANALHWRYLAPSLLLVHLAGLSLLCEPLVRIRRAVRPALAAALLLLPAAGVVAYGPPSLARVRADLDAKLGTWTEDVLAARCDLVAGDYWSVWPAVWHASWVARQRGLPAPYGITHRTNATEMFWKSRPARELRICRIRGAEAESQRWLLAFHLWPVRTLETRRTVEVVAPTVP
jgi:hypothetical protein